MKIVQVMPEFGLAGAEVMCENLIYELIKLGHEVTVISMFNYHSAITDRMDIAGVKIIYLDKKSGLDLSMISKINSVLKEIKPDVIHTHRYCVRYAMIAAILAGVKCRVHTVHNVAQKELNFDTRKICKFFYKHCGLIPVALSNKIRDTIMDEYKIDKDKIPVIFNGIDLSKCVPKEDYSVNGNFKILHIGRFSEQKNHSGLLRAFKIFHLKYPDSELWLIGDGEKRAESEEYVQSNGLDDAVKFFGLQSDVHSFLHDADIFTLPSNYEGIPMTLIEAMGTGLPIVATAVGGVPDMLDTNDALLVENDIESITQAYEKYYADIELRKQHGVNAKHCSETFSAEKMGELYEAVYVK